MRTRFPTPSRLLSIAAAIAMASMIQGCSGADGAAGAPGRAGADGTDGTNGTSAPIPPLAYSVFTGSPQHDPQNPPPDAVANFHGVAYVTAQDELQGAPTKPKYLANIAITSAIADASGVATVNFTVKDKANQPVTNLVALTSGSPSYSVSAGIFKLAPAANGKSYNQWVPYIFRSGRTVNAGYRENSTTAGASLVHNGNGAYTYTFGTNLSTATFLWDSTGTTTPGPLVGYDPTLTHRVSIYLGGHAGPTGEADFDFVPNGTAVTATRNIVQTASCKKCHGAEFRGHGGDRTTVEGCVTCHSPDNSMVNSAFPAEGLTTTTESIAMQVMLHKIHAGRELLGTSGPDGIYFDDPLTPENEAADNGTYRLGGSSTTNSGMSATWRGGEFPAVLQNCTVCHEGTGANVDNWKSVPSRDSCGSCHDGINWATGLGHAGGSATSDAACGACHPASAAATDANYRRSVEGAHDWTTKDIRNIPEYIVSVSTSLPNNGQFYVAGESPVVTVQLYTNATPSVLIDHTTVIEDTTADGCDVTATDTTVCTNANDPGFRSANMYVTGPRAKRIPVLTTPARARLKSTTTGPWDLSAGGSLRVIVDGGNFIVYRDYDGEEVLVPGDMTIALPANLDAAFTSSTAVTAQKFVDWLNGPTAKVTYNERDFLFSDRALAYVEGGAVSIRSRAKGSYNPSIQVPELTKGLGIFTNTGVQVAGAAAQLRQRSSAANADPSFAFAADKLTYTLDPVDDLAAGTYVINLEFANRGRGATAASYQTPSVAVKTFQVKTATVEKPIADGCTACHWDLNKGRGYVMDFPRHDKVFNAQVVDQCGGCHNYKSGETVASRTWTTGGGTKPISKRVHAVHMGAELNYPTLTVDHEESVPGRDWQIEYPQNIRNCESCHPAATTSGTWNRVPNRLACMGCHDSDAATAHMKSQVYDPTPTAPWSGDESEACATCH